MTLGQATAEVVARKLNERGWDHAEAARRAGIDRIKVWRMLTGVTKKIDLDTFDALAGALGMDPSRLMREVTTHRRQVAADADATAELEAGLSDADRAVVEQGRAERGVTPKDGAPKRRRYSA